MFVKLIKFQNILLSFLGDFLSTDSKDVFVQKLAVYRFGSFGDSIVAFPAIKAIREYFKNSEIHIYNKPESEGLVKMEDLLDKSMYNKIFTLKNNSSLKWFYRQLKKEKYDLFIELSPAGLTFIKALQKLLFLKLTGVKKVIGLEVTPGKRFAKYYLKHYHFISERERLLNNLKFYGIPTDDYKLCFPIKDISSNIRKVEKILKEDGIDKDKLFVFIPRSKKETNAWPMENWLKLSKELIQQGYHIAFIGGNSDINYIENIIKQIPSDYIKSYAGKFNVLDSAALLKLAKLAISIDTGPMHLAYAVGTKLVALFSARDYPEKWYPPKEFGVVLRKNVECSPCFLNNCPRNNDCMRNININRNIIERILTKKITHIMDQTNV